MVLKSWKFGLTKIHYLINIFQTFVWINFLCQSLFPTFSDPNIENLCYKRVIVKIKDSQSDGQFIFGIFALNIGIIASIPFIWSIIICMVQLFAFFSYRLWSWSFPTKDLSHVCLDYFFFSIRETLSEKCADSIYQPLAGWIVSLSQSPWNSFA